MQLHEFTDFLFKICLIVFVICETVVFMAFVIRTAIHTLKAIFKSRWGN
jgi:F0F1-type ATP synthase membrane subunit c/vacuolar-type H+-ATPase subunit K